MRHHFRLVFAILSAVMLAGCQTGSRTKGPDADNDRLPDVNEVEGWTVLAQTAILACEDAPHGTLPPPAPRNVTSNELRADTDGDGATDYEEFILRSDPNIDDTDGDGLTDGEETRLYLESDYEAPTVLSPSKADSDADCLSDNEEIEGLEVEGLGHVKTDPTTYDTDGDGLIDSQEIHDTRTDPNKPDTDGDGARDRFDADPRRDVWVNLTFTRVLLKETPAGANNPTPLFTTWVPFSEGPHEPAQPRPAFQAAKGQWTLVPGVQSPGRYDYDDAAFEPRVIFDLYAQGASGNTVAVKINPWDGQPLTLVFAGNGTRWAFANQGSGVPYEGWNQPAFVETAETRLEFSFTVGDATLA